MRNVINLFKHNQLLTIGLILLILSAVLHVLPITDPDNGPFSTIFFAQYGIAIFYTVLVFAKVRKIFKPFSHPVKEYHIMMLLLFNVSAYGLNRTLTVFNESALWVIVLLVIENIALIAYVFIPRESQRWNNFFLFIFTLLLIFNIYQSIVVIPLYAIGFIASFFFGISLHAFVPLSFAICLAILISDLFQHNKHWYPVLLSTSLVIVMVTFFCIRWHLIDEIVSNEYHSSLKPLSKRATELPDWINVAQRVEINGITEKYLKSGIIYQEFYKGPRFFWGGRMLNFEGKKLHDPLVNLATLFVGRPEIPEDTRLKILDYAYDARHETANRFWSGLNLRTSDVVENIQFFPAHRLAYTELILKIKNEAYQKRSRWFRQEEAIYTFDIPQGAAVTSLSLWIEGEEAKARLTTKAKAERAYNTIVGGERRDPSAVYWMEGNKIRVRVFPCTVAEDRQFKLGVTSPLRLNGENLEYQSITFKGPDAAQANTSINILGIDHSHLKSDLSFDQEEDLLSWAGNYPASWSASLPAPTLSNGTFSFNEKSYEVAPLALHRVPLNVTDIYFDIHGDWTDRELESLYQEFDGHKLYTISKNGRPNIVSGLEELLSAPRPNFSLFPFHKINNPKDALVITKGNIVTPNIHDLDKSKFRKNLFASFKRPHIKVFDLSSRPSTYIKSLKEFGAIDYHSGSIENLKALLSANEFPTLPANPEIVAIPEAGIQIVKSESTESVKASQAAPDHLLRMFAYNKIIKGIGEEYFSDDYHNDELLATAETANVVSPISSLIVLETLNDYKRFEIDENKNSLGNAAIQSSGAVPEPHEWAIIILCLAFVAVVYFKRYFNLHWK